ncbi:MAG: hypothetical protein QNJ44_19770 [Rhodobacter sp.]|nr:hypothetical protein [Rhodobacter sp.]
MARQTPEKPKPKSALAIELHRVLEAGRKDLNIGKQAFAERIGITTKTYRNWELGETHPEKNNALNGLELIGYSRSDAVDLLKRLHRQHGEQYIDHDGYRERPPPQKTEALQANSDWEFETDGTKPKRPLPRWFGPSAWTIAVAATTTAIFAAIWVTSNEPEVPEALGGSTIRGECVPRAGNVHFQFPDGDNRQGLNLPCPDTGWVDTDLPLSARSDILSIHQDVGVGGQLHFDFVESQRLIRGTRGVFFARRSPTMLLWARRTYLVARSCPPGATKILIGTGSRPPTVLCDDRPALEFTVPTPRDAAKTVEFQRGDETVRTCNVVFSPGLAQPIDLTDDDICLSDDLPAPIPAKVPLRPFWSRIDTYSDPDTGHLWMRDLHRYGPTKAWGPRLSLDQLLRRVRLDTGNPNWDLATVAEVRGLTDLSVFRWQFHGDRSRIVSGVAYGSETDCAESGLVRFAVRADLQEPRTEVRMNSLECNILAGEQGFWLVVRKD